MTEDNFITISNTIENLDTYIPRNAVLNALVKAIPVFRGKLLDFGCGKMPYKKYIVNHASISSYTGIDVENALEYDENVKPDLVWNGKMLPIEDSAFDTVIATEVLEHIFDPLSSLMEIYRILTHEGVFFFTVPFLWNLHEVPNDAYRYTPYTLERMLVQCGFKDIEIHAHGGWHTSMAQMLGIWVRRSPMSERKRKYLSILIKPLMKYLLKIGSNEKVDFRKSTMINGLYGIAKKI